MACSSDQHIVKWLHPFRDDGRRVTICVIRSKDTDEIVKTGESIVSPNDQFDRKVGRFISFKRAMTDIRLFKKEKRAIWDAFKSNIKMPETTPRV